MDLEKLSRQFNIKHPKPGAVPVPEGHVRLYHHTPALSAVRREGLRLSAARGHTYGEPDAIWATTEPPGEYGRFVEFSVDPHELDIGRGSSPQDLESRRSNVTLSRDVSSSEFLATHEPWHRTARYLMDSDDSDIVSLLDSMPYDEDTDKALEFHRRIRGLPRPE